MTKSLRSVGAYRARERRIRRERWRSRVRFGAGVEVMEGEGTTGVREVRFGELFRFLDKIRGV